MTAFSDVQDADVQQILGRPQLCEEPYHTTEILEIFCKSCQRCICQKCAIMTHQNHEFVHVDEAAHQAKLRLNESKKKVQDGVRTCKEQLTEDQKAQREFEEQIVAAEVSVQHNTQRFIQLAKQHERDVMTKLAAIRKDQVEVFQGRKENLELRVGQLSSVTDYLDGSVFERGISVEILRAEPSVSNRSEELLKDLGSTALLPSSLCDLEILPLGLYELQFCSYCNLLKARSTPLTNILPQCTAVHTG